MIDDEDLLKVT